MRVALPATGSWLGGTRFYEQTLGALSHLIGNDLDVIRVASMRASAPVVDQRLPMGALERLPYGIVRLVGAGVWGRAPLLRMDMRLPPGPNEIVTVLDFAPLHYDDEGSLPAWVVPSLRRSSGAVCLSPTVADEVTAVADVPTWVSGAGVDERFRNAEPLDESDLRDLGVDGPFVLSVGGTTTRKNLGLLARSWPLVRQQAPLTMVSIGPNQSVRRELFAGIEGVTVLDQVADALIPGLVAAARAVVIPSLYEGFGMPATEAMAAGTPVVAVRRASLPWVVGDAGLLVEPDPGELATAVLTVNSDSAVRTRVVRAGRERAALFTWDSVARVYADAYATIT